ncbi:MAG: Omp28-related outer membrane protein [Muribaculaceae bacterium]|nr:Omp28-related outer membrane protein [Muribaculaceae bacterium]
MKKSLSLLLAAFLLSLTAGAMELGPNQLLMGHYTTDSLSTGGWGQSFLNGVNPIATDITPDELALFQGGKIVAFRIGLASQSPITRLFVMPVGTNGQPTGDITEWPCDVYGQQGWTLIELEEPYMINLPDGYSLRIGFDYEQLGKTAKPISAVKVGTVYPTYIYRNGKWMNYGVNTQGNLSLQCVVENEDFPQYVLRIRDLVCRTKFVAGDDMPYSFKVCNLGVNNIDAGDLVFDIAIDGIVLKTITNPVALSQEYITIEDVVSTEGLNLAAGGHTLKVTATTLKGEPIEPISLSASFQTFDYGFSRQMHLVEQFTSTGCTWCPVGSANLTNLCNMRGDVAWVGVHVLFGSPVDPFATAQNDTLRAYQGIDGYPEGTFDRAMGIGASGDLYAVLSSTTASTMSSFLDYVSETPSWATVNINSTFDETTRNAVITVDGKLVPGFDELMGGGGRLTVYITEDNLVATQLNQGTLENNYVHNGVLRKALVSVKGVDLKKKGDTYSNEFTYTIPADWKAEDLNIVAFISRPLRADHLSDLYVTNANKRKLGEYDEPAIIRGDVDGDESVSISDVTALIDYLLTGTEAPEAADCDLDHGVSISDVTTLIDYLLSGEWPE